MSTRVHELAKELGLKSQDLLERIQQAGLEVKHSPLASLDEGMVQRIKDLVQGRSKPAAPPSPPPAPPKPRETPAISSTVAPPRESGPAKSGPVESDSTPTPAPVQAPRGLSSAPAGPEPAVTTERAASSGAPARPAGPLSAHTPSRVGGSVGRAPVDHSAQKELRPKPASPPPLKKPMGREDYISPTGTRHLPGSRPGHIAPPRRTSESGPSGPAAEAARRESGGGRSGGGRPLPPVAAPAPTARRPEGPRPATPQGKTQRPEKRYTPEELRAMMQAGQLGGTPPASGSSRHGPAGRPGTAPAPKGQTPPGGLRRPPGAGPAAVEPPPGSFEEEDRKSKASRIGSATDRAGRRDKRRERATERRGGLSSPVPASALLDADEDRGRIRGPRKAKAHRQIIAPRKTEVAIEPPITVRDLSEAIGVKASDIMRKMMQTTGELVSINATLEDEMAMSLALEFGVMLSVEHQRTAEDELFEAIEQAEASEENLESRPPVITILGHVDHGKTSLLDQIRKTDVVASESGGITQHIGAYQIEHNGQRVTFVDTPGHEAFTAMRARGANVTDIAVVVVAADDGVMPQTKEAIAHAKAADVPVVVALNKIDLPNADTLANITKIYGELAQEGLNPVEWGGDTEVVKTSATSRLGIDELLTTLEILAEGYNLRSNPNRPATGTCLEASLSEGRGVIATVLVQEGTLRVGDAIVCGDAFGRVRALFDDLGRSIQEAPPSMPVEISGLDMVPTAGETFAVLDDIGRARDIAVMRRTRTRGATLVEQKTVTLENLYSRMAEQKVKSLNLILKADVQGSLEALVKELDKLENTEVPVRVLLKGVGGITESDVLLADASSAIIIGFRVAPEDRAMSLADEKKIELRRYDIIYQVTDDIKKAIEGRLEPEIKETHLGRALVRQTFRISKTGTVAGCMVTQGTIERGAEARIIREGREIYKGTIEALKRFKDDVREVRENFECGIKIGRFDDIKVDDTIEAYRLEVIRRTL